MKHTEGKWIVGRGSHAYPLEILAATKTIAQTEHQEMTETEANAQLIANAPELLEKCKEMEAILASRFWLGKNPNVNVINWAMFKDELKQAINKVEGR